MRTGFTTVSPSDINRDYVIGRSTVVVQPLFVNLMWFNFPPELHETMLLQAAQLQAETEWYDDFRPNLPSVPYPRHTRNLAATLATSASEEEEEEEEDGYVNVDSLLGDSLLTEEGRMQERDRTMATLTSRLDELHASVQGRDFTEEQTTSLTQMFSRLTEAAQEANVAKFFELAAELEGLTEGRLEGGSNCVYCPRTDVEGEMVACRGDHAEPVLMHWFCNPRLSSMPQGM